MLVKCRFVLSWGEVLGTFGRNKGLRKNADDQDE